MKITRRFTLDGKSVYDQFKYDIRSSVLRNPDGTTVFEMKNVEVPEQWSQVATDILAYFAEKERQILSERKMRMNFVIVQ